MPQPGHLIRLRGGWLISEPGDPTRPAGRFALPATWPAEARGAARLVRRFNRPPIDDGSERVHLEAANLPGLISARLNGLALEPGQDVTGMLRGSNELVLEVDLEGCRGVSGWGDVALRIGPSDRVGDPGPGAL